MVKTNKARSEHQKRPIPRHICFFTYNLCRYYKKPSYNYIFLHKFAMIKQVYIFFEDGPPLNKDGQNN